MVARDWHASNQKWSELHSARVLKSLEDNIFTAIGKRNIVDLKT
ncbi:phage integrase central domain-containing protein [Pectobacterium polaris]